MANPELSPSLSTALKNTAGSHYQLSTTRMMLELTKIYLDVLTLPDDNSALAKATIMNSNLSHLRIDYAATSSEIPQERATLSNILNKLADTNTQTAKQSYAICKSQADPLNKSADELEIRYSAIETEFNTFYSHSFDVLKELMTRVAGATDPAVTAEDTATLNTFRSLFDALDANKTQFRKYKKENEKVLEALRGVILTAWKALPGVEQSKISLSQEVARQAPGQGLSS